MAKEATQKATTAAPVEITVSMTKDKTTKNAVRYQEDEVKGQAPRIGTLYVQKHALPDEPDHVVVTINVA